MEKAILVDGNNLLFRSYYATAYTGNFMRNSEGFPTNGLFGFVNMINKIISEEKPTYIAVAFDVGKTFRHEKYSEYKGGRDETPDDLKKQFPVAKKILEAMGIKYLECPGYEADDIIGTLAKMVDIDDDFIATIISSDKDLLQLISNDVEVKLLKQKDFIRMNHDTFVETYGIEPIRMVDLKGLMGDSSDNIPGVKGIGEKTALKLLQKYVSVEGVYEHIDEISGAVKNKLVDGKDSAFASKEIATIYKDVPLNITLKDIKYEGEDADKLVTIFSDLEFYSFLKKTDTVKVKNNNLEVKIVHDLGSIDIRKPVSVYLEISEENYHNADIYGMGVYNDEVSLFIPIDVLKLNPSFLTKIEKYTYDLKKLYVSLRKNKIKLDKVSMDAMIAGYLLNYNVKDDIAYLANDFSYDIPFYNRKVELDMDVIAKRSVMRAKFIYEVRDRLMKEMEDEEVMQMYNDIELPLAIVLGKMECNGIRVSKDILQEMGDDITLRLDAILKEIYDMAGCEFNVASPKQLGQVLFEKLGLPGGKKTKSGGYTTDSNTLNKYIHDYPIVSKVLEYRTLSKLLSTYVVGITNAISDDGKIHTIYTQTLTRTGRLSSIEPNLQNIPVRNEYGKLIRKAFLPEDDSLIMSADYSQIELRIFAHLSQVSELIHAFNSDMDIHAKTASDVFHVSIDKVTKDMRRQAKAVNFGILYGISSFGLSEDLGISPKEAKEFINKYLETYPGIKDYMNKEIEQARELGYVKTIMNRKRLLPEIKDASYVIRSMGERMALNTPIQGSSADILKKAMVEIDEEFTKRNLKSTMLLQVHDELIFNCLISEKEIVTKVVTDIMENTYKFSVPLTVDVEFGTDWYDAK